MMSISQELCYKAIGTQAGGSKVELIEVNDHLHNYFAVVVKWFLVLFI